MKKLLTVGLLVVLILTSVFLTSCGAKDTSSKAQTTDSSEVFTLYKKAMAADASAAEKLLRKAELPVKLRRLFPSSQFARGLKSKRDSIERAVYAQLTKGLEPPTEETRRMVKTIAESIESQLTAMMRRATLRIH